MRTAKPSSCANCPLFKTGVGFVLGQEPKDWSKIRLLVQGEAPGKDEVDESAPFVGKAGWWIKHNILGNAGIPAENCVFDNTLRCLPPRTRTGEPYPVGLVKIQAEQECRQYDIWHRAPLSIPLMLVGGKALHVGMGLESISEYHGHITKKDGRLVGCTFHPSAVMRNPNYLPVVIREFTNLVTAARMPNVLLRPTVHRGYYRYEAGDLVTDFEWNPESGELICIGISQNKDTAYSAYTVQEGLDMVESVLATGEFRVIGHNLLTADLLKLNTEPKSYGPKHVIDTMVISHLIHAHLAESGLLDLGSMVRFYEPCSDWKHDHSDMLVYNGLDCVYNWRLWTHLKDDLTATDQWHLVEKQQTLAHMTALMKERGVRIDAGDLREYASKRDEERKAQKATFSFNPNSPAQITKWCKEQQIYVPNARFDTLVKHQGANPDLDRLIDYRMDSKNLTTWFPIEYGGKKDKEILGVNEWVHPMFHTTGTDVARFSCSGPNFQNLPPALRRFIIPRDPELELNAFDGSQIENRTSAWIAGAKTMLDAFASGVDFHTLNAANIQSMLQGHRVTLEEVTKEQRQQGKTVTHATNYKETVYSLAGRLFGNVRQESIRKAGGLQEAFFKSYPEMRTWHTGLERQFDSGDVMVRNPFGRVRFVYAQNPHEFAKRAAHFLGCSTAADVVNQRMIWVWQELKGEIGDLALPILVVHDELVYEFPKGSLGLKLRKRVKEICDQPIPEMGGLIIPFVPALGSNYGKFKPGVNEGGLREV